MQSPCGIAIIGYNVLATPGLQEPGRIDTQ